MSASTPPPAGLEPSRPQRDAHRVALTHWSVVAQAAKPLDDSCRGRAREEICRGYWYPLYVYLRRQGRSAAEAEDLVQGFFLELFEKNLLSHADPNRGRFRTFLLTALARYAGHQHREQTALKRGGNQLHHSLDVAGAEERYAATAAATNSPEAAFDRAWALTLLDLVLEQLSEEYLDRPGFFDALRPYLTADSEGLPYALTAENLGISALNVKVTVHRLRQRYRKLLDDHLAETLGEGEDLESERAALIEAVSAK